MEPKSPSKVKFPAKEFNPWKRVLNVFSFGFLILLSSIGVYLALNFVKARNVLESSYYTVVVDCGSTGTRVNVFEWGKGGLVSQGLPSLLHSYPDKSTENESCHYHCMQTEPGLDKFVGNASGVRASLEPLIAWAEQRVPRERHGDTPIIVLATAGLRRLVSGDAKQVLDDVEIVLREHSFAYAKNWIRVLTGKEEAYYGWVALNYKMGSLGNSSKGSSFGLLDLGGSSLQVVVEVADENDDGNFISNIGSTNHNILAYSLPAFGLNEAFDQTVVLLSQNQADRRNASNRQELRHPCLSSNFVQNYTCSGCAMLNITDGLENSEVQMHKNLFSSIHLAGDLNWEQCKELVRAAAMNYSGSDWSKHIVDRNCAANLSPHDGNNVLNLTPVAHHSGRFHALSGFFVVYDMLNLSTRASVTEIWEKGEQLCSSSSSTERNIDFQRQKYVGYYCFRVSYVASIIEDALCLGNAEIVFGPGDLSWTLGAAVVHQLNANEALASIPTIKNLKIFSSTVFLLVLLLTLFLVAYCSPIKLPMLGKKVSDVGVSLPSYYVHARLRTN